MYTCTLYIWVNMYSLESCLMKFGRWGEKGAISLAVNIYLPGCTCLLRFMWSVYGSIFINSVGVQDFSKHDTHGVNEICCLCGTLIDFCIMVACIKTMLPHISNVGKNVCTYFVCCEQVHVRGYSTKFDASNLVATG